MPQGLTVIAAIRPGREDRLREVLRPIGDDIRGARVRDAAQRPHIDFCRSRTVHFARFAILDDPDRGSDRRRLLYSSNYDGELDEHVAELMTITSGMDEIWGCCEGYDGAARFGEFIHAHRLAAEAFYIAFRHESVERIRRYIAIRQQAQPALDAAPSTVSLGTILAGLFPAGPASVGDVGHDADTPGRRIAAVVDRLLRALPLVIDVARAIVRCGVINVFLGARRIIASLDRYTVFRWFNWLTRNRKPSTDPIYSSVALDNCAARVPVVPGDEFPSALDRDPPSFREDVVAQNQLTVITVLRPGQIDRVRSVMSAIESYASRLAPDGSLIGVSTIHFVRWVLLDEGRRLVLLSDYDGSWEAYIDEFAEMILSGLDAIWETAFGYPPDGARDLPAFKQFLRNHQVPSELFYSAYPDETVLNIIGDRAFARACARAADGRAGGARDQV